MILRLYKKATPAEANSHTPSGNCHCEERSDEASPYGLRRDCFGQSEMKFRTDLAKTASHSLRFRSQIGGFFLIWKTLLTVGLVSVASLFLLMSFPARAEQPTQNFPLLANYYLEPDIPLLDQLRMDDYDILILDMEAQHNYPGLFAQLRQKNPDIKIFAYVTAQHIPTDPTEEDAKLYPLRTELLSKISSAWFLRDSSGQRISDWPHTHRLSITSEWKEFLPQFVKEEILSTGLWDGVFFDGVEESISWVNNGDIDLDNDGKKDQPDDADWWWKNDTIRFLQIARANLGETLILANTGFSYAPYLNGLMMENFGNWPISRWAENFGRYREAVAQTRPPHLVVINANTADTGEQDYRKMRWTLGTALLSDGYYSYDFGPSKHGQTWWYDEYEAQLGEPIGPAYEVSYTQNIRTDTFQNGMDRHKLYRESELLALYSERIDGPEALDGFSVKAVTNGKEWNEFLRSDHNLLQLRALASYKITFDYKILDSSRQGYFYFGARSDSLGDKFARQLAAWNGPGGQIGRVTAFFSPQTSDYYLYYGIKYDGSVVIDNIQVTELNNSIWRRDFTQGAVIVNSSFIPFQVDLGGQYQKLSGTQQPEVNDGAKVSSVTVAPQDAIILLGKGEAKPVLTTDPLPAGAGSGPAQFQSLVFDNKRSWQADLNHDGWIEKIDLVSDGQTDRIRITSSEGRLLTPLILPFKDYQGYLKLKIQDFNGDGILDFLVARESDLSIVRAVSKDGEDMGPGL